MGSGNHQFPLRREMSQSLKNFVAQKNLPPSSPLHDAGQYIADTEKWQKLADLLYGYLARNHDEGHLKAIGDEIEHALQNAGGVLVIRYTRREPNGAGQTVPHYLGLRVAGTGDNESIAIADYEEKKRKTAAKAADPSICTPQNPSGRAVEAEATISAPPPGFNMGYNAQLAGKIYKVLSKNPENENRSSVFARETIEETYVFISREQWAKMK